ncbi:hypothetical protein [Agromyces archimandritae]|uniref:hypothetical protein n=1 Tax=Agromyces archimandritae TaxID=2781962 RepID=UPI001FD133DF|nr:hypothetical protein [Agromyces archimandritae]
MRYLADVDLLATAVEAACREADPAFRRINIEILGNTDAFVHTHIWPRHEWERPELVTKPVWQYEPTNWSDPETALGPQHDALRARIADHLHRLAGEDETVGPKPRGRLSA